MRGVSAEQLAALEDKPSDVPCGNPCTWEYCEANRFDDTDDDDQCPTNDDLVKRGLMVRHECELAIHYRNTPLADLLLPVFRATLRG